MKEKVVVGMSGGVDSSVAAWLLKKQGYDVIGVTMQIWQEEDACQIEENGGCCGLSAVEDARRVADSIGIPHYVMNFREIFKEKVINNFISEYMSGRTPNPCIVCNRFVKWEALLEKSMAIGADKIATGHYAKLAQLPDGRFAVAKADTDQKDQTYALYSLTQEQLKRTLFPLGHYDKPQIRQMAAEAGLIVANKPDSQDICFVPDGDYQAFIEKETGFRPKPGAFVDQDGNRIGQHKGISAYTIGQRKGLNLAMGHPVYVTGLDVPNNRVIIGENEDLFHRTLKASHINCMAISSFKKPVRLLGKIRYNHKGAPCMAVQTGEDELTVTFDEPQRAITPGQALVLYDGQYVAGGGIIEGFVHTEKV